MAARLRRMLGCTVIIMIAPWPDLQPELLGLVLLRIPSRADRACICAVCRSWHSGFALREGNFLSLLDGAVHRMLVPDYDDVHYRVSTGNMLFLVEHNGRCSLKSPSSGKAITLQINRVIWSSAQLRRTTPNERSFFSYSIRLGRAMGKTNSKNITIYALGPQGASAMEWAPPVNSMALDIALFHGKLYVLTREHSGLLSDLHRTHRDDDIKRLFFYLVASENRLLMVGRIAADLSSGHGWWSKVKTLMGHALFVSQGCSHSLGVGRQSVSGGAQEDCIYFMSERSVISNIEEDFLNSSVYNISDQTVGQLPLETPALHRQV
ncbi:hypothetical protein VPH35_029850 [Triticum aestivum]